MAIGFGSTRGAGATDKIISNLTGYNSIRSWSLWAYRNGLGGSNVGRMFARSTGATGSAKQFYVGASVYSFNRGFSGVSGTWTIPAPSGAAWHHFLITYDSSSTSNYPSIWVNGVAQTVTRTGTPTGTASTTANNVILGNVSDNSRNFDGDIAEFAVWNGALGLDEATALSAGISPLLVRRDLLVEHLPLVRDVKSSLLAAPTVSGTAAQAHPRVFMPKGAIGSIIALGETTPMAVSPGNASHVHSAAAAGFSQTHQLVLSDSLHGHTAPQVTFTVTGALDADPSILGHSAGSGAFTQTHNLATSGTNHGHTAGSVAFVQQAQIIIAGGMLAHQASSADFSQLHILAMLSALHITGGSEAILTTNISHAPLERNLKPAHRISRIQPAARGRTLKPER